MSEKINKKSLVSYLIITFGLTVLVSVIMAFSGARVMGANATGAQVILAGMMFIPALATIITRCFITHEGWASAGLKWGRFKDYFNVWLLIPTLFLIIFLLTYVLGATPDLGLLKFTSQYGLDLPAPAPMVIAVIFLVTLFVTPFVNSIAGFGEELGWRGHLLPHLLPLGVKKALVLQGIIWGLWHVPFILLLGFGGFKNVWVGSLFFITMATLLGIYIGYLRLRSGSSVLAGWAHGTFNSQSYGIWLMIFPEFNNLVGGITGVAGLAVWWVLVWYSFRLLDRNVLARPAE